MDPTDAVIGTHHGSGCRCHPMEPITATVTPVIINPSCPVQREVPRTSEVVGRIAIAWRIGVLARIDTQRGEPHDPDASPGPRPGLWPR